MQADPPPEGVPPRVVSKLALYTPARELVDAYLYEIARGYGVNWMPDPGPGEKQEDPAANGDEADDGGEEGGPGEGQQKEPAAALETAKDTGPVMPGVPTHSAGPEKDFTSTGPVGTGGGKKLSEEEELAKRFERLKSLR